MRNFIPISELQEFEGRRIVWNLVLPDYAPSERIGVNIQRLGRIARIGGFNSLTIDSFIGETSSIDLEPDSVDKHGQATAVSKVSAVKAKIQRVDIGEPNPEYEDDREYVWPDGVISLNLPELDERVAQDGSVRGADNWSKHLNEALKQGVNSATINHLIEAPTTLNKSRLVTKPLGGAAIAYAAQEVGGYGDASFEEYFLMFLAINGTVESTMGAVLDKMFHNWPISERRFSLICGMQFDRAILVSGISRTLPLVKALRLS